MPKGVLDKNFRLVERAESDKDVCFYCGWSKDDPMHLRICLGTSISATPEEMEEEENAEP